MGTYAYSDSAYGLRAYDQTDGVVLDGAATVSSTSSLSVVTEKLKGGSASIAATSSVTASGESIIIERSDKVPYGAAVYGYNRYDLNDLQTIVSVTSALTVAQADRVRIADASLSATSGGTASGEVIKLGAGEASAASTVTAQGFYTIKGVGIVSVQSAVTINVIRRRKGSAISAGTSGTLTIGREKWEPIPVSTSPTWTIIAA